MKKRLFLTCAVLVFVLGSGMAYAQEIAEEPVKSFHIDEDEGPVMFKFEPDYLVKNQERKAEISRAKKMIDTMNLSDRKRHKLLRDLYKNGWSKRLQKALLVTADFEDVEQ